MKLWTKRSLASLGFVGVGSALALALSSARWNSRTSDIVEKLMASAISGEPKTVSFKDFHLLPAPVAKYFRLVLKEGQPLIRAAHIQQEGKFFLNDKWIPFVATQHFSCFPPGMIWDADMRMSPLLNVRVRDAYLAGEGSMQGKILALVSVLDEHGKAELNAGALQRYLAEAAWFPTALLPSENLKWSAIDEYRALATLSDAGLSVSLEFSFNDTGEITGVYTPGRYREVEGKYEPTPWAGYNRAYEERDGMRIPMAAEVEWQLPDRHLPYCKLRVVKVEYEFAR